MYGSDIKGANHNEVNMKGNDGKDSMEWKIWDFVEGDIIEKDKFLQKNVFSLDYNDFSENFFNGNPLKMKYMDEEIPDVMSNFYDNDVSFDDINPSFRDTLKDTERIKKETGRIKKDTERIKKDTERIKKDTETDNSCFRDMSRDDIYKLFIYKKSPYKITIRKIRENVLYFPGEEYFTEICPGNSANRRIGIYTKKQRLEKIKKYRKKKERYLTKPKPELDIPEYQSRSDYAKIRQRKGGRFI